MDSHGKWAKGRRRSRFKPRRSKPEGKRLAAVRMNQRWLFTQRYEFVSQLQPATQTPGGVGHASRPRNPSQRSSHAKEIRILPYFQKGHARPLRKGQLEVPRLGKTNEDFADQARSFSFIKHLAVARLPVRRGSNKLWDCSATRKCECEQRKDSDSEGRPLWGPSAKRHSGRTPRQASLQRRHVTTSSCSVGAGLKFFGGTSVRRGQSGKYRCTLTSR